MTDDVRAYVRFGVYLLERQCGFISVLVPEIIVHAEVRLSAQLVARLAVRDALNHSALWRNTGSRG